LKAARKNSENGLQITELLLNQPGTSMAITADIVKAAAGAEDSNKGRQVMELLPTLGGDDIEITEKVA
jgi:hypothetical protein